MDHCSVPELRKKEATVRRMGHQHPNYILNEQGEHRKPRLPEMILILDAQTLKWPNPLIVYVFVRGCLVQTAEAPMETQQLLTVTEVSKMLRIGRTVTYQLIREGAIRSIQVGKRSRRIPAKEINAYIERALQQSDVLVTNSIETVGTV